MIDSLDIYMYILSLLVLILGFVLRSVYAEFKKLTDDTEKQRVEIEVNKVLVKTLEEKVTSHHTKIGAFYVQLNNLDTKLQLQIKETKRLTDICTQILENQQIKII